MTIRRRCHRLIGMTALALVAVTGCGDDDGSGVPEDLAIVLQGDVDAIWQAAVSGDADGAVERLEELRALVQASQDDGILPPDAATRILVAADTVQARLGLVPGSPTTVPASDTTGAPATGGGDRDDDEGSDETDITDAPESTEADTTVPDTDVDTTVPDTEPDDGGEDRAPGTAPPDTDPPVTQEATPSATESGG